MERLFLFKKIHTKLYNLVNNKKGAFLSWKRLSAATCPLRARFSIIPYIKEVKQMEGEKDANSYSG